jgi:hypothetical protein
MISTNDVLRCMKDELAWALEGSAAKWGEPYVLWSVVPDWSELRTVRFESRDSIAVCVESEVFFEDTLDQVEGQGWIQSLDPRYVAFRLIDRGTSVRKSVILVREDQVPSDRDLFALPFMVRCDNDVMRLRTRAAGITFTGGRSTQEDPQRKPDRREAETVS